MTQPETQSPWPTKLRDLLNQWDPIGVADIVDDEYDCLLAPLWTKLKHGATRGPLAAYLETELREHFGLDPDDCDPDGFAATLLAWAASRPDDADGPSRARG